MKDHVFNNLAGVNEDRTIKVVIEIPKNSSHKIEWRRHKGYFALDRVEPGIFSKPVNYGFIPQTLDDDDDELDALIVTEEPLPFGIVVPRARVLGVMFFIDGGENDHKIICVPEDDRHQNGYQSVYDLGTAWQQQVAHHFQHYKDLKKKGTTQVGEFGDPEAAWRIIKVCQERAAKNPWW